MADPLSVAASAVGIISLGIQLTQSLVAYYNAVKSQDTDIAYTVRKLDNLLEILDSIRHHVDGRRFRADEQDLVKSIESLVNECKDCIQELQDVVDKFTQYPLNSVQSAIRTTTRRLAYPFRKSTLEKLDEDVDDIVDHLTLALQLLQQEVIGRVQDDLEDVKALLRLVRSSQVSSDIQQWLKAPDATTDLNEACKQRQPQTGLWLVKGGLFTSWLDSPRSFLWLRGFAGCGKSVLCSTAIQYTYRHRRSNPRIGIAFFFFKFNNESKQDASALLRAIVLQLSTQSGTSTDLTRLRDGYRQAAPPDDVLLDHLRRLISAFQDVYILIDALDESPRDKHREAMLQLLVDIRAWEEPRLHLLVTSRDEVDIRNELDADPASIIEMKNNEVDRDIAAFISQNLQMNRKFAKWKKHHGTIEKALTQRSNGVFRWVECQFRSLARCPPNQQLLEKLLHSLPESLDETYARMLSNIAPELVEYAQQMFSILCCAARPLLGTELLEALAVNPSDGYKYEVTRKFDNLSALEEICPGFIEVDTGYITQIVTVRITHFSVQEFLEAERILRYQSISLFHIRKPQGHTLMAGLCLALLLRPYPTECDTSEKVAEVDPMLAYAAQCWPDHLKQCHSKAYIESQALPLFQVTTHYFGRWAKAWNASRGNDWPGNQTLTPLYYASLLGLTSVVITVLSQESVAAESALLTQKTPKTLNAQGGHYGTALQAASRNGHKEIVELLLEKGAEINIQSGQFETALQAASYIGHKEIVELLLEKGAEVNIQSGKSETALQAASRNGHKEIVELLLEKGAEINIQSGHYGTALQAASCTCHKEIVELLLEKGAEVNIQSGYYGTALQAVSRNGHKEIVRLLLEKGAEVNIQSGKSEAALQAASRNGHKEIVELLLEKGAEINIQSGFYGTALQAASCTCHKEIVELLLEKGAEVNIQSGFYGTALQAASRNGHKEIVELLLEKGAEVNIQSGHYETALQAASRNGHKDTVELLLEKGAEVNIQSGYYGTALQATSRNGHKEIVELLLEKGADVNIQSGHYGTALQAASRNGHKDIVELLIEKGADLTIVDNNG
ncbi:hypothetical protein TruAng_001509 [Truncatella angustata]|nr:hypothetical protein TruAng_001509 [Truncatella angustata]